MKGKTQKIMKTKKRLLKHNCLLNYKQKEEVNEKN